MTGRIIRPAPPSGPTTPDRGPPISSNIYPGCEPVTITGRNAAHPPISLYAGDTPHPLVSHPGRGDTYIVHTDLSDENTVAGLLQTGFAMRLPHTTDCQGLPDHAAEQLDGVLLLDIRDSLFIRDLSGSREPGDDFLVTFGHDLEELGPGFIERAQSLQDDLFGDDATSAPTTTMEGGVKVKEGGAAFERDPRSTPIEGTQRAYAISLSVEIPKGGMHAPFAGNKFSGEKDHGYRLRKQQLELVTEVATRGLDFGPPGLREFYAEQSDLVNAPPIGYPGNVGFTNMQTNYAAPVKASSYKDVANPDASIQGIGPFAKKHIDEHDAVAGVSSLFSLSRLQRGVFPGIMTLVSLGVGWKLTPFQNRYMCGLHGHGGTTPIFDDQAMTLTGANIRALSISYMVSAIMDGRGPSALAAMSPKKLIELSPEFRNVLSNFETQCVKTTHAVYAADGLSVMSPDALAKYIGRELAIFVNGVLAQVPPEVGMRMHRDGLLQSITYLARDGQRKPLDPWPLGPGYGDGGALIDPKHGEAPYGNPRRVEVWEKWGAATSRAGKSMAPVNLALRNLPAGAEASFQALPAAFAQSVSRALKGNVVPGPGGGGSVQRSSAKRKKTGTTTMSVHLSHVKMPKFTGRSTTRRRSSSPDAAPVVSRKRAREDETEAERTARRHESRCEQLLDVFSLHNLSRETAAATNCVEAMLKLKRLEHDTTPTISALDNCLEFIAQTPLARGAPSEISRTFELISDLSTRVDVSSLVQAYGRARVMMAHAVAQQWFDEQFTPSARAAATELLQRGELEAAPEVSDDWIAKLVKAIYDCHGFRKSQHIRAANHIPDIDRTYVLQSYRATEDEMPGKLVHLAGDCVKFWLRFPCKKNPEVGARFITHLLENLGRGPLYLERVWHVYRSPQNELLGQRSRKTTSGVDELAEWQHLLERHPVAREGSAEWHEVRALDAAYKRVGEHPALANLPPSAPSLGPCEPQQMLDFLRLAARLLPEDPSAPTLVPDTMEGDAKESLEWINANTDHRLPFRHHGKSYRDIEHGPRSPLSPDHLRTREGFFSMLLWRGVTYHSEFVAGHQLFSDAQAFLDEISALSARQYVINDCYGGQAQAKRTTELHENVAKYDQASRAPEHTEWLLRSEDEQKATYMEVFEIITKAQHSSSKEKAFPLFGALTAHLLVSDYVDAGVVEQPTAEDMADIIATMQAGAIAGLQALNVLRHSQGNRYDRLRRHEVSDAFVRLYRYLEKELNLEEKRRMRFSPIMLEHALCKFQRFVAMFPNYFA